MAKKDHSGNMSKRVNRLKRIPDLGYYLVVTDTKGTEGNYINGLKNTLPAEVQGRLVIKVINDVRTLDLVRECKDQAMLLPQYSKPWIMFDRDEVISFDNIIKSAENQGINVAWSNRCLEVWFEAYFQNMTYCDTSEECWKRFAKLFEQKTGKRYKKSDPEIYDLLKLYGDEEQAIKRAAKTYQEQIRMGSKPSAMNPSSTVYLLVDEIRKKIKK